MKRVKLAKEPGIKRQNWCMKVLHKGAETHWFAGNKAELKEKLKHAPDGSRIHVYKVIYNFKEAWQK